MVASHNLRGAGPNIQTISIDSQSDPLNTTYIDKVISVIKETLHKAQGLEHVLITPFVHQITLQRILSEVQKNEWCYEYRNPADHAAKSTMLLGPGTKKKAEDTVTNKTGLPFITFCTGNHVDGAEYGAVIVLLERSLPKFWEVNMHASLFIAITRATTMLSIVVNNTMNVPLIQKKTETINADAVPKIWNDLLTPADFDIPAYSFIECKYNDVFHSLERIITNSTWSRGPVLILGEHDSLSKFDEIDQPKDVWVNGSFTDEIKWYNVGTKIIVCARKYESSCRMFDRRMYMNMTFEGFSALIFLISSTGAYEEMLCNSMKHALMYYMFEEMLGACPIYILTSCSLNPRCRDISRINLNDIGLICDFFTSFNRRYEEKNSDQPQEEAFSHQEMQPLSGTTTMTMRSWNELKELGNSFFKDRNYEAALSMYIDSTKMLRAEFYNSLENQEIDLLIELQDERSKLCTNVSKTQFELATHGVSGLDVLKMELSLRYAEKSVELNPFWFKGHHRVYEAKLGLKEECSAQDLNLKKMGASLINSSDQYFAKRLLVLKEKLQRSCSWELIRFKDNAFLVDKNGQGHFKSIREALGSPLLSGEKPISLLINKGIYEELFLPVISGATVDMVGNLEPKVCETNQWILDDPPVVIQSRIASTIYSESSTIFLSRLSVYNWSTDIGHAVGSKSSSVSFHQCAFRSKCGAAVVVDNESNLNIDACRSVDTFGAVLAVNKSTINISRSYIQKTKVMGLEFRDNIAVNIDHCSISHCEKQGITNIRGDIFIESCFLESNSYKLTLNEGSIQLDQCNATVKDTKVINQLGNGIVIQYGIGKGIFDNVKIDRCRYSGLLIQAPSAISGCNISNCVNGITICNDIKGDVTIENCAVTSCNSQVYRFPLAVKPTIIGNLHCTGGFECKNEPKEDVKIKPPVIRLGRQIHEKSLAIRKYLEEEGDVLSTLLSGEATRPFGCAHCSVLPYKKKDECFLCKDCDAYLYCSVECWNKDKEIHRNPCADSRKHLKAYRDSINWSDAIGKVEDGSKNLDDQTLTRRKPKGGKRYWGPIDSLLEEEQAVRFYSGLKKSESTSCVDEEEEILKESTEADDKTVDVETKDKTSTAGPSSRSNNQKKKKKKKKKK